MASKNVRFYVEPVEAVGKIPYRWVLKNRGKIIAVSPRTWIRRTDAAKAARVVSQLAGLARIEPHE